MFPNKFPYKEITTEIHHYIGWSQQICVDYNRNGITVACWKESRDKLCGQWGRNNGLFQENDIEYQNYLRECKFKGIPLATFDFDFIRSLFDLIHLTHSADNGDISYPYPSHCSWQGDPLMIALSWLKWIYGLFPDDCKKLMQEYQGKMIPDNINVDYEVWADSILMVKKTNRMPKEKKTIIESIKNDGSFLFLRGVKLIDDSLIWYGKKSDLTRWLRGMPIKINGECKTLKPKFSNTTENGFDWKKYDRIFRVMEKGKTSDYLTSDKLRRVGNKTH